MLWQKQRAAVVTLRDCACGSVLARAEVETYATDEEAAAAFLEHQYLAQADDQHRYWCVHGPSGHVIAIRLGNT